MCCRLQHGGPSSYNLLSLQSRHFITFKQIHVQKCSGYARHYRKGHAECAHMQKVAYCRRHWVLLILQYIFTCCCTMTIVNNLLLCISSILLSLLRKLRVLSLSFHADAETLPLWPVATYIPSDQNTSSPINLCNNVVFNVTPI